MPDPCGSSLSLSRLAAWPVLRSPLLERPGIGSALHASHATKCYVFPAFLRIWKTRFWRKLLINRELWPFVSRSSFDENQRNSMTTKELRHSQSRSFFRQKPQFCPFFGAFYPHFANQSALRAARASRYPAPKERAWPRSLW